MCYNKETNSYFYYSKSKDIPYKYLETVARKYVIDNKCISIYIDYKDEYIQGVNKYNEIIEKKKELIEKEKESREKKEKEEKEANNSENKPKKNIYATFKTYNKQDNNKNIEVTNNNISDKQYILTENSNHYKYEGNLLDYENMRKEKEAHENCLKEYEQVDFKTYKDLIKKNE